MPVEVAEPDSLVVADDAGHGNRDNVDTGHDEIDLDLLLENRVVFGLVVDSREFDRVQKFAGFIDERQKSFCPTDVHT